MALATQCPHCLTTFRVAADQLKLRGGIVRCGACQSIFDGSAHLIELDKPAPPAPSAPPAPAVPDVPSMSDAAAVPPEDDALPVYTLDFSQSFEPLGILPNVAAPAFSAAPLPDAQAPRARVWRTGTSAQAPVGEPLTAATPDEAPSSTAQAAVYDTQADAAADAATVPDTAAMTPDSAPAASYETPPAADAYAPAGRIAPILESLPGAHADATAPDAGTDTAAGTAMSDAGSGTDTGAPAVHDAAPASAYAPASRIEPTFGLPVDEEIVARPLPDGDAEPGPSPEPEPAREPEPASEPEPVPAPPRPAQHETEPAPPPVQPPAVPRQAAGAGDDVPPAALLLRTSAASESPLPAMAPTVPPARSKAARASEARARRSKLTPTKIEPPKLRIAADTDVDEPEFVKRSRRQERTDRMRRLLMIAGAVVLAFALLAQVVLGWRNVLAAEHPGLKPVLAGACAVLGCRVELPALADNLVIETGELTTLGPNTYALNTLLRNQGSLVLAWPSIELELTDAGDRPVLRRVLAPNEYLPAGISAASGFGPHSEQPVTLHFTLAGLQPSGYHTFVFYP